MQQNNLFNLPPIRLAETGNWVGQSSIPGRSTFLELLTHYFPITYIPEEEYLKADFLICGDGGFKYEKFPKTRIFITAENHDPNLSLFDYCLTHNRKQNDRCLHFPYWLQRVLYYPELQKRLEERPPLTVDEFVAQKREFCNFICRNHVCRTRNRFVKHLSERKRVNCPGPFMHNTDFVLGKSNQDKYDYQEKHIFSVAYENEASPGYTTEKIVDAFVSRTIPIYWGDPTVEEIFNPEAFIHARRFANEKELIDYVIALSEDAESCVTMLNAPVFRNPAVLEEKRQELLQFMANVFRHGGESRRTRWQRIDGQLCRFYGHGLFRTLRRITRAMRGKA